ncbi:MAG: acyloxyacyl hydrolase [Chlamydiota bacterium]
MLPVNKFFDNFFLKTGLSRSIIKSFWRLLTMVLLARSSLQAETGTLVCGVGLFDVIHEKKPPVEFSCTLKPNAVWHTITPALGLMVTEKWQTYLHLGFAFDWVLAKKIVFSPNFAAGWYQKGQGKDLGFPLEFRSGIELGWAFSGGGRLALHFYHLSNASLGTINPGSESLVLIFSQRI